MFEPQVEEKDRIIWNIQHHGNLLLDCYKKSTSLLKRKHIFCDAVTCSFSSWPRLSLEEDTDDIAFLMLTEAEVSCFWNSFQIAWDCDGHRYHIHRI